jgi:hypothetical protein
MAIVRAVQFDGVTQQTIDNVAAQINSSDAPPAEIPAKEIVVLWDPESQKSLTLVFFENEADYQQGDAALNAMPAGDTPGTRTSVAKYQVAVHKTA